MGLCSIATILQLFSLNSFWVFRPIPPLCCHIPGCGVYLDSWKSGKPQHALCAWAAHSRPGLLCALLPPSWGCLRWVALIRHYLSLDTKLSHTNCSHVLQLLDGAIYPSFSACPCSRPRVSLPWWTHADLCFQGTHAWVLWALFSATCLCESF